MLYLTLVAAGFSNSQPDTFILNKVNTASLNMLNNLVKQKFFLRKVLFI
jgi:hypothetical protein